MEPLSFKTTSDRFLLCVFLSLLWVVVTDSNATKSVPTPKMTTTWLTTLPPTKPPPPDAEGFNSVAQSETSITLQWNKVNDILNYTLLYSGGEINVAAPEGQELVTKTITGLTSMTQYDFTLSTVFENIKSSGVSTTAFTAPPDAEGFNSVAQSETSITLQWNKVNDILNYTLLYSGGEINVAASVGQEPVTHTITGLTSMTQFDFTLFTVFENIKSSGVNTTAFTAPPNAGGFKSVAQSETSITLQWNKVKDILDYTLLHSGGEINVAASVGQEPVTHTITGLKSMTQYDFTLFTVYENIKSSGVNTTAFTAPPDAEGFNSVAQSETSITLQWNKVKDILNYTLLHSGGEINVAASVGQEPVTHTITGLTNMTQYDFTLFTVFENIKSSGVNTTAFTAPLNAGGFKSVAQSETSITLQWNKVKDILDYTLLHSGGEINVAAPEGQEPVTHTITGLTNMTQYDFTLFTVFENIKSSGVNITAFTAPLNAEGFNSVAQNETSITLQWNKVNDILDYTLLYSGGEINVAASVGQELVTKTITGLTSMTQYDFTLSTVFENIKSSGVNTTAFTAPPDAGGFKSVGQSETSITLQWNKVKDILDYTLLHSGGEINVAASVGQEPVTHTILALTSGTKYSFTLFTVFEKVRSSGVKHDAPTAPGNVKNVIALTQNESSITLKWDTVKNMSSYLLQYDNREDAISIPHQQSVTYKVYSLNAGTKYHFTLITRFEKVNSTGFSFNAVTVPLMVISVNKTERSVTNITLTWPRVNKDWDYFLQMNGEISRIHPKGDMDVVSHTITSLQPGTEYPFSLITGFSGLNSTAYEGTALTTIDCAKGPWRLTNSSIRGTIEGVFSNATATNTTQTHVSPGGGDVSFAGLYPGATYEVSLVYERNSETWLQCSHNLTIIPAYLSADCEYWDAGYSVSIVWNKPEGVWTSVEVNVSGKTRTVHGNYQLPLTISGFQPAKTYEVSLALLSGTARSREPFVFSCLTDPRGVIAGAVFAVIIFCLLICLAFFIYFKRPDIIGRKIAFIGGSRQPNKKCKPISVAKFPDHFYQLGVDENRGFSLEYESLIPVGTEQTRDASLLPQNKARNRFNNVLPYDWCRVKLTTSNPNESSDYINAGYIPGYKSDREYIATQGPLPSTVKDFWRMIWEQRVNGIVMVTNCTEGGRTKCEQYWPADTKPCSFGALLVTIRSEQQEPNWTLREFRVKHGNTSEERTVRHFHFTAWPDHGVPQGTEVLIQFRELVRQHIEREGARAPTVVHCSAGVGRTGTIIALDVLLQQLEKESAVGINGFVHKMRLSRPHMVQTESQYIFLHQCMMDRLQTDEKTEENIYENVDMIYANATALREFTKA
ncbi:receptor-type tyrosine-protein phosphatase H-like [Lycodopsis pacificus]